MTTRRDVVMAGLANGLGSGLGSGLTVGLARGLTAGLAGTAPLALAQSASSWPEGPVKIIVPFAAGNAADVLTRLVAEKLAARLGQPFVVENKVGAGGLLGMEAVRTSKPDGHTIVSATIGTLAINQFLFKKMPHDPEADFACASLIWENCNVFVVQPQHPAKTLQELIAWSRAKPKGANIGTSALGARPGDQLLQRLGRVLRLHDEDVAVFPNQRDAGEVGFGVVRHFLEQELIDRQGTDGGRHDGDRKSVV